MLIDLQGQPISPGRRHKHGSLQVCIFICSCRTSRSPVNTQCLCGHQDTKQPCSLLLLHCGRGRCNTQKHIAFSLAWLPQQITCLTQVHCSCIKILNPEAFSKGWRKQTSCKNVFSVGLGYNNGVTETSILPTMSRGEGKGKSMGSTRDVSVNGTPQLRDGAQRLGRGTGGFPFVLANSKSWRHTPKERGLWSWKRKV